MIDGELMTGTSTGTYTVNPNGTGTVTFIGSTLELGFTINSTVAKVAHGFQFFVELAGYNGGNLGTGLLISTAPTTYTAATLKSDFGFGFDESTLDTTVAMQCGTGLFIFDGKGNVTGSVNSMVGGVFQTGTFTGTYTVNDDGSGSISLNDGPQYAFVLNTVTGGLAKGLMFIQTNTTGDVAIWGTGLKQ